MIEFTDEKGRRIARAYGIKVILIRELADNRVFVKWEDDFYATFHGLTFDEVMTLVGADEDDNE